MFACLLLAVTLACPGQVAPSIENPMELSPEMKLFLANKVDRGLPPFERLQALVSAVFHDSDLRFTYVGETRTAAETFAQRNGNCLSFTLLFISLARHMSLDARFREVDVAPTWTKAGAFINLGRHVNSAVFVGGQAYSIDVFPGLNPIEIGGRVVSDERGLAHFYNNKGVDALGKGNYGMAESFLQQALQADPTTASVWINLGAARNQRGNLPEAERYYRKALELDPRSLAAMSNLANVFELTGRTSEANRLQAKVRKFREKNPYHHYNLGLEAYNSGKPGEAIVHLRKALKLKPTEHHFYFALARIYANLGQEETVIQNLQLAEKFASDSYKMRYAQKPELLKGIRSRTDQKY